MNRRWAVETRCPRMGAEWTPYTSPEGIPLAGLSETAAKRHAARLRRAEPACDDGDLEYRAREVGGATSPESARSSRAGSIRMAPDAWAALDAYAARLGVGRGAAVARLVKEIGLPTLTR